MELVLQVTVLAFLVEAIVETLKLLWKGGKINGAQVTSLVVGLILAGTTGVDVLQILAIPSNVPVVGVILTGILISRGGNFVHELFDKLNGGN